MTKTKKLILAFSMFFVLLVLTIGLFVVVNKSDEELSSEVKQILNKRYQATENERNAYFFVLGMYSGENENPRDRGEAL
jgi:hypothetical protein